MLKRRIIPCLDIKDGRTVKGINFVGLQDAGDPIELAKKYVDEGADELVFLDITATIEKRKTLVDLVSRIAKEINIPFTVGGGINSVSDAYTIINAGADKISINSAALRRPLFISELASRFGSQAVVVAIDCKKDKKQWSIYSHGGTKATNLDVMSWSKKAESLGAGEILLTSMDKDGSKTGFDLKLLGLVSANLNIPVIASGGGGLKLHFEELFKSTEVTGALAASIFHYNEMSIDNLKQHLRNKEIAIR